MWWCDLIQCDVMTYPKTSVLISGLHIPSEACRMIKIISKCEILRSEVFDWENSKDDEWLYTACAQLMTALIKNDVLYIFSLVLLDVHMKSKK